MNKPVILADGDFPSHPIPLGLLKVASPLVCCDGAADAAIKAGFRPDVIIGDLDSLASATLHAQSALRIKGTLALPVEEKMHSQVRESEAPVEPDAVLIRDPDQETNDLTKAVNWCRQQGMEELTILGATGKREDHTLANIALLARYNRDTKATMVTDHGTFVVIRESAQLDSYPGQQVSLFSLTPDTAITSAGLKYPLNKMRLSELWQGSLNEAEADSFSLTFDAGIVLIYRLHPSSRDIIKSC